MNPAAKDFSLTLTRTIAAPPGTVFDAWLDPAMLARFMTPGPDMTVPRAETDPRVGGRFDIVMKAGDQEIPHWGHYRVIARPERLEFTWVSPYTPGEESVVTLTFRAVEGGTEVTLDHVRLPTEESRDNHQAGWSRILETLAGSVG